MPAARFDPQEPLFFDLAAERPLLDRNAPSSLPCLHVDYVL